VLTQKFAAGLFDGALPDPGMLKSAKSCCLSCAKLMICQDRLGTQPQSGGKTQRKTAVPFCFAAKHVRLNSAEHRTLARQTATEGAVLLRNPNKTLPLDLTKLKKLAVIGPNGAGYEPVEQIALVFVPSLSWQND
jgi:beta-glucosidase-like glycosyl hydrolase